jgi:hypothetical protein
LLEVRQRKCRPFQFYKYRKSALEMGAITSDNRHRFASIQHPHLQSRVLSPTEVKQPYNLGAEKITAHQPTAFPIASSPAQLTPIAPARHAKSVMRNVLKIRGLPQPPASNFCDLNSINPSIVSKRLPVSVKLVAASFRH